MVAIKATTLNSTQLNITHSLTRIKGLGDDNVRRHRIRIIYSAIIAIDQSYQSHMKRDPDGFWQKEIYLIYEIINVGFNFW